MTPCCTPYMRLNVLNGSSVVTTGLLSNDHDLNPPQSQPLSLSLPDRDKSHGLEPTRLISSGRDRVLGFLSKIGYTVEHPKILLFSLLFMLFENRIQVKSSSEKRGLR